MGESAPGCVVAMSQVRLAVGTDDHAQSWPSSRELASSRVPA
jgi:hypothetical protein